jgi:radical SAM protein with 4Fe4S-binding SPASM domain
MCLLEEIRRFGRSLLVFTGGDPLKRPDLFELIAHAKALGLAPGLSPSGTPLLDREALIRARSAGVSVVSISFDAPDAARHDAFRGVQGAFARSVEAARTVTELGMRLQVNTVLTGANRVDLPAMAALVNELGAARWEVFGLVPTGRGSALGALEPAACEEALNLLFDLSEGAPYHLTVVEAPHYRRVVLSRLAERAGTGLPTAVEAGGSGGGRFLPGMNDGRGLVFVSHTGEVMPSGFLPLSAGNVRQESIVEIYRDSPLFKTLRDSELLEGKCGRCQFRRICGGSRARAYATTGNPLAEDPACIYQPA